MSIEKKVEKYEILVRFEDDKVKGCHIKNIQKVVEGEEVLYVKEGVAEPITMEEVISILQS